MHDLTDHYDADVHEDFIDWQQPGVDPTDEELAEAEAIDVSGIGQIPVDALRVFILMLLPSRVGATSPACWRTVTCRLIALAHSIGIDGVSNHSLESIAKGLGVSRALLSLNAVRLRDFGNLGHRTGRSDAARAAYANRASEVWRARRENA